LKVPFPILITSLPKSATSSSTEFLKCGKQLSFHHVCFPKCPRGKVGKSGKIALKVQQNARNGLAPLEGLPRDTFSDFGYEDDEFCFHPSFHLQPFYDSYPNMTILHITRNTTAWLHSIARYDSGRILQRWSNCSQDPLQVFSRLTKNTSLVRPTHTLCANLCASPPFHHILRISARRSTYCGQIVRSFWDQIQMLETQEQKQVEIVLTWPNYALLIVKIAHLNLITI